MTESAGVINPPMVDSVEMPAVQLDGILSDLVRTAGKDPTLPMLCGVILHTERPTGGENRIYGTSTNRFILGQAWEPVMGALTPSFLDLDAVALIRSVLGHAWKGAGVVLDRNKGEGRDEYSLDVHVLDVARITVPIRPQRWPNFASLVREDHGTSWGAQLAPEFVNALALIGQRRKVPHLTFAFGEGAKPTTITIGQNYRAMLMPVRANPDPEFRYCWPGLPERGRRG